MENGTPDVIPNRGGYKTTPSMVAITEAGKRLVGHIAKRQAITNAENTVYAAKRLIGRKWNSPQVKNAVATSSYRIVEGPHDDVRIVLRDKEYSVPEISAMVLQEMKLIAEDYLGEPVTKAVITVPAYFNDNQRQATKDAGADRRPRRHPHHQRADGGGARRTASARTSRRPSPSTTSAAARSTSRSSRSASSGVFKVIATAGDTFLGGEDFDARIIDWLVQGFKEEHGDRSAPGPHGAPAPEGRRREGQVRALERARDGGQPPLHHLERPQRGAPPAAHARPRRRSRSSADDLIERTIDICQQTLEDARLDKDEIEEVVLVGGMTRMPKVQQAVARRSSSASRARACTPTRSSRSARPSRASALVDDKHDMVLLDVTPHALGIMTFGGYFEELIPQNTTVPTHRTKIFTTSRDNQTAVKILVMQGESERAEENELLGEFILTGLRRAPKGQVEIEVTFEINARRHRQRPAPRTSRPASEQSIQVTASSGLTQRRDRAR